MTKLEIGLCRTSSSGYSTGIDDGDTITILDAEKVEHKVRLQGIDALDKWQAFGTKSKQELSDKIARHNLVIEWKEKDRHGRVLGQVLLDGRHSNLEMVQEGGAWRYTQSTKSKELARAEQFVRQGLEGLWTDKDPIAPWEFRKQAKNKPATTK